MNASFVIGFHTARIDNLIQTLRFLWKHDYLTIRESQIVLMCQNSTTKLSEKDTRELFSCLAPFKETLIVNLELPCMQLPHVTNLGVEQCKADKIIVLESDRILPEGYFASVIEQLVPGVCITTKKILKLKTMATDDEIAEFKFDFFEDGRSPTNEIGRRNLWSGNTAFIKEDFYKAGAMDPEYHGYGWADSDMTNRMAKVGILPIFRNEIEYHLWHPPATYGTGDQKQMFIDNGIRFCKIWGTPYPPWFIKEISVHKKVLL